MAKVTENQEQKKAAIEKQARRQQMKKDLRVRMKRKMDERRQTTTEEQPKRVKLEEHEWEEWRKVRASLKSRQKNEDTAVKPKHDQTAIREEELALKRQQLLQKIRETSPDDHEKIRARIQAGRDRFFARQENRQDLADANMDIDDWHTNDHVASDNSRNNQGTTTGNDETRTAPKSFSDIDQAPNPFFNSPQNFKKLLSRLRLNQNSAEAKNLQKIFKFVESTDTQKDLLIAKQMGHVNADKGRELIGKNIRGAGRIIESPGAKINILHKEAAKLINMQSNSPTNSIVVKLYSQCQQLCETQNIGEIKVLQNTIKLLSQALNTATIRDNTAGVITSEVYKKFKIDDPAKALKADLNAAKQEVVSKLYVSTTISELSQDITRSINTLNVDESYIMNTGYKGHSIYHKFTNENGKIILRIYNGGGGSVIHAGGADGKVFPYRTEIPKNLGHYVKELLVYKYASPQEACGKIYFAGSQGNPSFFGAQFKSEETPYSHQTAGNCSWHNLTEALADEFGGTESVLNQSTIDNEMHVCERLKVEGQGINYNEYTKVEDGLRAKFSTLNSNSHTL